MNKNEIIKILNEVRKEDKELIKDLIRINERLSMELKDILRELQKFLIKGDNNE
ncbi:MAG: hypothetical protein IJO32_00515 [Bacilli bacterium]|nr:hypothetical protein [Bacilli bacterium]